VAGLWSKEARTPPHPVSRTHTGTLRTWTPFGAGAHPVFELESTFPPETSARSLDVRKARGPCGGRPNSRGASGGRIAPEDRGERRETRPQNPRTPSQPVTVNRNPWHATPGFCKTAIREASCDWIFASQREKWWTGGELNSRHRDFQSRAFACRGADFRTWSPKRGPSGFTCWSRHPQSLGLSAPGCGKSRPWKRPAAHAESSLRVYTPKRLGRVSALSRLKHGSRLVGDWLKSDQSGRGPRLSPLCRSAADPRRGDGVPRRAPAPRGARGSPPEPPPGRTAPTV
jgi:hypothetical protein